MAHLRPSLSLCLALLASSAGAAPADSFTQAPVVLVDYGVICQTTPEGRREAPETLLGEINLIRQNQDMDVTTRVIPAKAGISFGVKFLLEPGAGAQDMRVVVRHPPMGEQGLERESWFATARDSGPSLNLFSFEYPYELVQGPWSFSLESEGAVLMEQHFTVVPPEAAPGVLAVCFGQDFVS